MYITQKQTQKLSKIGKICCTVIQNFRRRKGEDRCLFCSSQLLNFVKLAGTIDLLSIFERKYVLFFRLSQSCSAEAKRRFRSGGRKAFRALEFTESDGRSSTIQSIGSYMVINVYNFPSHKYCLTVFTGAIPEQEPRYLLEM